MFQDLAQIWHPAVMRLYVPFAPPGQLAVRRRAKGSSSGKKRQTASGTRSNMNLERGSVVSLAQGDKGFFEQHASQSNLRSSMVLGGSRTSFASIAPTNNAAATKSNMNMMGDEGGNAPTNPFSSGHNTNHHLTTSRPYFALIGTKNDLSYSRAVNLETHQRFAYEQNMYSKLQSSNSPEVRSFPNSLLCQCQNRRKGSILFLSNCL